MDGMRSWTPIALPTSGYVTDFRVNPFNGDLLMVTSTGWINSEQVWVSADAGQQWAPMQQPPFPFGPEGLAIQQPYTDQPWHVCGADPSNWYINGQHNPHTHDIECTGDGGATWVIQHLDVPNDPGTGYPAYSLVAIADDGSVLGRTPAGLVRFTLGSTGLEPLGPVPQAGALAYAAGMGAGVLWSGPFDNAENTDPQGRIFNASYA
jgi:hypothetical protein